MILWRKSKGGEERGNQERVEMRGGGKVNEGGRGRMKIRCWESGGGGW